MKQPCAARRSFFRFAIILPAITGLALLPACSTAFSIARPTAQAINPLFPVTDTWAQVQSRGKIRVGISTDTAPFAYYTAQFQPDGFDVAVLRNVGHELGVHVEFHDFASDGLAAALQSEQIDAAVVRVTTATQAFDRLSNVFFFGDDSIVAADNSGVTSIASPAGLKNLRVGVVQGSIYQPWLNRIPPAESLTVYARGRNAIADLRSQAIDVAVFDRVTAQSVIAMGGVHQVGQGLYRQELAIGTGPGGQNLLSRLNDALAKIQQAGQIIRLAQQYLALSPAEILPIPPATRTATANNTAGCANGLAVLQHVTPDDQHLKVEPVVRPGEVFTSTWRIGNSGTCPWYIPDRIVYLYGNAPESRMGSLPVPIERAVAPGESVQISVRLKAPVKPGDYGGVWQMVDGRSIPFGERLQLIVSVIPESR